MFKKNTLRKNVVLCVTSLLIGVAGTLLYLDPPETTPSACAQTTPAMVPMRRFTPEEQRHIDIYEHVNQSVVNIATGSGNPNLGFGGGAITEGIGSGSVLDREGHILTNNHVIEGARIIQVTLYDGNTYNAKIVGRDAQSDVAVLKIDALVNHSSLSSLVIHQV